MSRSCLSPCIQVHHGRQTHLVVLSSTCILTACDLLIGGGTDGAGSRSAFTIGRGPPPADGQGRRQDQTLARLIQNPARLCSFQLQCRPCQLQFIWPDRTDSHACQAHPKQHLRLGSKSDGANKMRGMVHAWSHHASFCDPWLLRLRLTLLAPCTPSHFAA